MDWKQGGLAGSSPCCHAWTRRSLISHVGLVIFGLTHRSKNAAPRPFLVDPHTLRDAIFGILVASSGP